LGASERSDHDEKKDHRGIMAKLFQGFSSIRLVVLVVLCLQNSLFTVIRRYSQGVLKEDYSKYECLLLGEIIKMIFSAYMIGKSETEDNKQQGLQARLKYLVMTSRKMIFLALIYGAMNILSFVSLRNIGAGVFTVFAQCKILTTATFSTIILQRKYSSTKWRALLALVAGVLLFSEPIWSNVANLTASTDNASPMVGIAAVLIEVTLSGFASIYFEKVIKTSQSLTIWERNFQLAMASVPVYLAFMASENGGPVGLGGGWSWIALLVSCLGAAGGLLVALSIKYGDSILKTLATTGAIILSSVLDHMFLGGPLTAIMMIAGAQVIISICNYSFDATPVPDDAALPAPTPSKPHGDEEVALVSTERN
jgi:UDP-sugar transporter A1/2/3